MDDKFVRKLNYATDDADLKLSFFLHLSAYLAFNSLFIAINLHGASNQFWAKWPIIIWGFILVIHSIIVFKAHQKQGNIRQDMIKKELPGI